MGDIWMMLVLLPRGGAWASVAAAKVIEGPKSPAMCSAISYELQTSICSMFADSRRVV